MSLFAVTGSINNTDSDCHHLGKKSQRWDIAWMHLQEISLSFPSLQLWRFPCSVGWGWIREKVKLDKIAVAQAFQGISRKATENLTQRECYLTNPDTTVGCWKTRFLSLDSASEEQKHDEQLQERRRRTVLCILLSSHFHTYVPACKVLHQSHGTSLSSLYRRTSVSSADAWR